MSDLGRLFRFCAFGARPLENFTTEALAIAISHDDRPIKRAFEAIEWKDASEEGHAALAVLKSSMRDSRRITAETQKTLWPGEGVRLGYLDLVLNMFDPQERVTSVWVEVKVHAWESGDQLAVYQEHAGRLSPPPAIITLGRTEVSRHVPLLKWSDIGDAIAAVPDADRAWLGLRDFLSEEKVVRPPLPTAVIDEDACIEVVVDVNRRIRHFWPRTALVWASDGALRRSLKTYFEPTHELVVSAGPLSYGLTPVGDLWEWRLTVTTRLSASQRVRLDPQQVLRDAEQGGLASDWAKDAHRYEVLERRLPLYQVSSPDQIVAWFDEGLRQVRGARILDQYFAGLATKAKKSGGLTSAESPASPTEA